MRKSCQIHAGFVGPDLARQVRDLPALLPKLILLDGDVIRSVVDAYAVIEQHADHLLLLGAKVVEDSAGDRQRLVMQGSSTTKVIGLNKSLAGRLEQTIALLTKQVGD